MSKHNIGPLNDQETGLLIIEHKKGRSIDSIARDMVRPPKFIYRQLESLGLVHLKGEGIIICRDCQSEVKAKTRQTKRCSDCADKRWKVKFREYRKHSLETDPIALNKDIARRRANYALIKGRLIRPERCELCNQIPKALKSGRTGLRMDHYKGYDECNWLNIQFICVACDTKQINNEYTIRTRPT